jgi:hypothetical protein
MLCCNFLCWQKKLVYSAIMTVYYFVACQYDIN